MRAVYREVIKAGGLPVVAPTFSGLGAIMLKNGSDEQITHITPLERFIRTEANVVINIMADTNTKSMASVDTAKQRLFQSARRELMQAFMDRTAAGELKWTLTLFPTDAYAQDAGQSTDDYANFVFDACKLNSADPVA